MNTEKFAWVGLRIVLGTIFLWAFLDKLLGLGYTTERANAWINGASPTLGFLTHGTVGPFAEIFQNMAGNPLVDWLFMLGLLGTGVTLLANWLVPWGALSGALLMFFIYLAAIPPEHNPIFDDHIVYIFALAVLGFKSIENRKNSQESHVL